MKFSPFWRRLLLPLGLLVGYVGCTWMLGIFEPGIYYRRDFLSDYLPARALVQGGQPYAPLPELAKQFAYPLAPNLFQHPTPHTPGLLLLSMPIGLFDYHRATIIWLVFSLLCLLAALRLLLHGVGASKPWVLTLLCGWLALAWGPLTADLLTGQIDTWLLLLAVSAWLALRAQRPLLGGALLGGMLALKLLAWPFGLYLLLRRQWRALTGLGLTFLSVQLLAAAVLGGAALSDYYLKIGPAMSHLYRAYFSNLALVSWSWRVFQGTSEAINLTPRVLVQPLLVSPTLARVGALLLPLLFLSASLTLACRARNLTTAFCLLLCASLLAGPLCWFHYFTILLLPLAVLMRRLNQPATPPLLRKAAYLIFLLTAAPHHFYINGALKLGVPLPDSDITLVPFAANLLATLGTLLVPGWMYLLWRTDRNAAPAGAETLAGAAPDARAS